MPVILRLLGNIYLAFIHSSWLIDSWIFQIFWLIRDMAASLFKHLLSVLSPWKHFRAAAETWGSHFVFGSHVCIVFGDTAFCFLFFPKEGSKPLSQCQAPQNPGLALPRVQVNKRRRALAFIPHLLREHCWASRRWRRPGATGLCSAPSQRLVSSKCQAGTVKGQETSSVGEHVEQREH